MDYNYYPMDAELMDKLCERLQHSKKHQNSLRKDDRMCCLGVACDVLVDRPGYHWTMPDENYNVHAYFNAGHSREDNTMPRNVAKLYFPTCPDTLLDEYLNPDVNFRWATGYTQWQNDTADMIMTLADLNDYEGWHEDHDTEFTHKQIADIIRWYFTDYSKEKVDA